ncbi:uncharacterized protein [Syngnathus scovelli]|uniref:uncharacterized protein n=1 Tax=Syngnathus scovelli TaxID=161590 RepID=UPI0021101C3F|nr:uncharacterized protein LOC125979310 [Syngnathus scovelli]
MDTFRLRLLLLLLLLPPLPVITETTDVDCNGTEDQTKDCKCEIGQNLKMKPSSAATGSLVWKDPDDEVISTSGGRYVMANSDMTLKEVEVGDAAKIYTVNYLTSKFQKFKVIPLVVCETNNKVCNTELGQNVRLKAGSDSLKWYLGSAGKTTTNGNLDILNIGVPDLGNYVAKANADSAAQKTITLAFPVKKSSPTLKPVRQVEVKASSGLAKMGTKWSLECVVTQNGTLITDVTVFTWLKDGKNMMGKTAATVDFAALKATDAGTYVCEAGKDKSAGYDLTLLDGAIAASYSLALLLTMSLLHLLLCY